MEKTELGDQRANHFCQGHLVGFRGSIALLVRAENSCFDFHIRNFAKLTATEKYEYQRLGLEYRK